MSRARCQQEVDSAEFGDWLALYQLEAEERGDGPPTPEQLAAKMGAFGRLGTAAPRGGAVLRRRK